MAESNAGWWGWLQTAKEKVVSQSAEVLEFVVKDIEEFKTVVSEEASSLVSSTATTLREKLKLDEENSTAVHMKKSVSGFINHVAEVFTPLPDDDDQEAIVICNQQPVFLDRFQAAVFAIQQDPATYLIDPIEEEAQYEKWLESFDLEQKQNEVSHLLVDNESVRSNYTSLVPSKVSHLMFWHRYFYKIEKLEKAEAKREELKKRTQEMKPDGDIAWDDEEDFGDEEISEQMQQKLLEDYEKECKNIKLDSCSKKKSKNKSHLESEDKKSQSENDSRESPASTDCNDDEWEKVNPSELSLSSSTPTKDDLTDKSDDWEKWE